MNRVVEYIIGAKDATAGAIRSALARLRSFASGVGSNLMNIRAGFGMLRTAISSAMEFMRKTFAFEKMTVQFKTLIGNMDEARAHMRMLQELGNTPPFSLEEFAAASRQLMVMTEGALGYKKSLELIGDAAAATGQPIQNLAHEIGRAFAIIRDGQPLTRATMGLRNMGAITPEVAAKLDELQKSGASTVEIWKTLEEHLQRFKGAMKETEQTGEGIIGAIQSQWDTSLRTFGDALLETAKGGLGALLEKMKELNEDGTIALWAEETMEWLDNVAEGLAYVGRVAGSVFKGLWNGIKGTLGTAWAFAAGADQKFAEQKGWEKLNILAQIKAGANVAGTFWDEQFGEKAEEEARKEAEARRVRREELRKRQEERRKNQAKGKGSPGGSGGTTEPRSAQKEEDAIREAMEEGQRKIDDKKAKERAEFQKKLASDIEAAQIAAEEKAAMAALNSADKIAQKRAQLAQEYADALLTATNKDEKAEIDAANTVANKRLDMEKSIADEVARIRKDGLNKDARAWQKELTERQKEEADAKARLQEAERAEKQAWGWYRDRDSWTAQLAEERADKEAQKQFDKDFENLKSRYRDWRTSDRLSDDDELIRRVALAREEKAAAEQYARETAEATQACADALEAIQAAIETEES